MVKTVYNTYGYPRTLKRASDGYHYVTVQAMDAFGHATVLHEGNGVTLTRGFSPFGQRRTLAWRQPMSSATAWAINTTQTDRGYTGQESLDAVGLVDYNARLYDPALGRFLSVDPLIAHPGSTQSINPYSYVENNPLNKIDPTGMLGCRMYVCHDGGGWNAYHPPQYNITFEYSNGTSITLHGTASQLSGIKISDVNEAANAIAKNSVGNDTNKINDHNITWSGGTPTHPLAMLYSNDSHGPSGDNKPSYSELAKNYPTHEKFSSDPHDSNNIWAKIGGHVQMNEWVRDKDGNIVTFRNTCAIQMSYALNHSGVNIPYQKGTTVSGADGKWYFFRLSDLRGFLGRTFGEPRHLSGNTFTGPSGQSGILIFDIHFSNATGHATLWNGRSVIDAEREPYDLFPKPTGALFWGMP